MLVTALNQAPAQAFLQGLAMPPGVTVGVADSGFAGLDLPEGVVRADDPPGNLVRVLRSRQEALTG